MSNYIYMCTSVYTHLTNLVLYTYAYAYGGAFGGTSANENANAYTYTYTCIYVYTGGKHTDTSTYAKRPRT